MLLVFCPLKMLIILKVINKYFLLGGASWQVILIPYYVLLLFCFISCLFYCFNLPYAHMSIALLCKLREPLTAGLGTTPCFRGASSGGDERLNLALLFSVS